ncbi:hypothetical protein [Patulibacter sp.]|uniref:hypothetical protein n=1 Tax=Patulibacter sp. TaxID=1912859 RepID=UPI00271F2FB6|nr:hypothetical protein [Patulibacter sp.]MDO9410059.1 hypothetical protein [Patulibacter sp.]
MLATDPQVAALSHWSAAHLHGMTTVRRSEVHVTVPGSGGRAASGLVIHTPRHLPPDDVGLIDGLRATTPARTVLDVATDAGDRVVERLIREGEFLGLLREGAMLRAVTAHPRHPGAARVRRVDPGTVEAALRQTPLEDELDALVRTLPLPPAERQLEVRGLSGTLYRLDLGWSGFGLGAEADGRSAHERASSLESDRFRDNDLAGVGWAVLRFTRRQLIGRRTDSGRQLLATAVARGWLAKQPTTPRQR